MARPTKFSDVTSGAILSALRAGCPEGDAAGVAGIDQSTLIAWKARYPEFRKAVSVAKYQAKVRAVGTITKAVQNGSWKAALEFLKRRYPSEWGDRLDIHYVLRAQAERLSVEYNEPVEQVLAELEAHAQKVLS